MLKRIISFAIAFALAVVTPVSAFASMDVIDEDIGDGWFVQVHYYSNGNIEPTSGVAKNFSQGKYYGYKSFSLLPRESDSSISSDYDIRLYIENYGAKGIPGQCKAKAYIEYTNGQTKVISSTGSVDDGSDWNHPNALVFSFDALSKNGPYISCMTVCLINENSESDSSQENGAGNANDNIAKPSVVVNDNGAGTIVDTSGLKVNGNAILNIHKIDDASIKSLVKGEFVDSWSVEMLVNNAKKSNNFGSLTISFPVKDLKDGTVVTIWHISNNSVVDTVVTKVKDGYATFQNITSLSDFAITKGSYKNSNTGSSTSATDGKAPKTGGDDLSHQTEGAMPIVALPIASLAILGFAGAAIAKRQN